MNLFKTFLVFSSLANGINAVSSYKKKMYIFFKKKIYIYILASYISA